MDRDQKNQMPKRKMSTLVVSSPPPSTVEADADAVVVLSAAAATSPSSIEDLGTCLLSEIFSYIGPYYYFFVATINHQFRDTYQNLFRDDYGTRTNINASTLGYAKVCFKALENHSSYNYQSYKICNSAAKHGNLPALQYLVSVHCRWDERVCADAARNGHLHIIKWARENDGRWDSYTCENATKGGHLHVLQYALKHRCDVYGDLCTIAETNNQSHVLEWLVANGYGPRVNP